MSIIKIDNFAGVAPRYSPRLLPNNGATRADNAKLLSGELRGLHEAQVIKDFNPLSPAHPVARAFRIPSVVASPIPMQVADNWVYFFDSNVDFVRTPVFDDSFERYYWTGDSFSLSGAPQYNTRANILAGNPPFFLGVPTPVNAPSVAAPAGVTDTRAYVYTFVSGYGEEGPPSPPTLATGDPGTWAITGFDTTVPDASNRNITTVRIYHTVASATGTEFFFVADISLGTTSYNDNASDASVANNNPLPSLTWLPPPTNLLGVVAHPGGFLVGFSGRDLYMSEPFQPHAWPVQYVKTCQTEIVGIAIYGNTILVTTTSHPYFGEGMSPLNITLEKLDSIDPCVSRRSIAATLAGIYYASPQGIVVFNGTNTQLASYQLFTREEWQDFFSPTTVYAVPYGLQYIAFDTSDAGFIFSPSETLAPLTTLDRFSHVVAVQQDAYTGDVYLISNNQALLWDPPQSLPYYYTWISKQFDLPNPVNFGAARLKFAANPVQISEDQLTAYTTFNTGRIAKPLNCIGLTTFGGVRVEPVAGYVGPQIKNPIGGSPLFPIGSLTNQEPSVQVNIFARDLNSVWNQVFSSTIGNERIFRLPTGFKSDGWQVELIGNSNIYSFAMAETATELKKI